MSRPSSRSLVPYRIYIGIDPGKHTGIAIYSALTGQLINLDTLAIHRAFETVLDIRRSVAEWASSSPLSTGEYYMKVRLEDARQVKYKTWPERAQGAGSVKRDVEIWVDFLTDHGIDFELVRPNPRMTKWSADLFRRTTGWKKRCSQHARDAAMLVYKIK